MNDTNPLLPLTPAVFHILLALSGKERHGYSIMKQVEADAQGKVKMGTGTLYGSLKWVGTLIDQMPCSLGVPLCD